MNNNTITNKKYGYKVFNPDWTCRGFQYEIGKTYELNGKLEICKNGFHYCEKLASCFNYYDFNPQNKVALVEILGETQEGNDKSCTDKIKILEEISWNDVLNMVNTGYGNTGFKNSGNKNSGRKNSGNWNSGDKNSGDSNSGDRNSGYKNSGYRSSGNWNSGDKNSGHRNSGDKNAGDKNSGYRNSGDKNSGDKNLGDWNSGDCNSGDWNSGDWNKTNGSSGVFNTEEENIRMFNKPSDWTFEDWRNSDACLVLSSMPMTELKWILINRMTDKEKEENPSSKITGGYLKKVVATDEDRQRWWNDLIETDKDYILNIPNFDKEIFEEITGIDVEL